MIVTRLLDGRRLAAEIEQSLAAQVAQLPRPPRLTVVVVGDDPASAVYVRNKTRSAARIGIASETVHYPTAMKESDLVAEIDLMNYTCDGLIVQLPLPPHIRRHAVIEAIDPRKDVDGFHPLNVGWLMNGSRCNVPCTPQGILKLLASVDISLAGAQVLVVGASAIVGRPLAALLTQADATVTLAHKLTRDLPAQCACSDIIVVAAGCPNLIRGAFLKPGAVVIDVGINRRADGSLCGDVAFDECFGVAGVLTPVPGGVGPMTIACLMQNTVESAIRALSAQN